MEQHQDGTEGVHAQALIRMGFDVLHILSDHFRREMGREFDNLWVATLSELEGSAKEPFHGITPHRENFHVDLYLVKSRYEDKPGEKDDGMILDAFAELIDRVINAAQKVLGKGLVEKALQEAIGMLSMVDKYKQDQMPIDDFRKKIQSRI